jgi:hypothetical protein
VLAHDRRGEGVIGLDGDLVRVDTLVGGERSDDSAPHLLRRLDGEGEAQDLAGTHAALDQADDMAAQGVGLAGAGSGGDPKGAAPVREDASLLVGQVHSGTSAP